LGRIGRGFVCGEIIGMNNVILKTVFFIPEILNEKI
jgi:hypothetical protein